MPDVNAPIVGSDGTWLAEGDLVWQEARVIVEYQGAVHADRLRRSKDSQRNALLREAGWFVIEMWAEDLPFGPRRAKLVYRVLTAIGPHLTDSPALSVRKSPEHSKYSRRVTHTPRVMCGDLVPPEAVSDSVEKSSR
ncbi:MAG: DUF559 domain-containing protein [Nostocoides sp.]